MNDYINKVHKIIYDDKTGTIAFILKTDGDQDFWYWYVNEDTVRSYFKSKGDNLALYNTETGTLSKEQAERFCNSDEYDTAGVSVGGFDTIDEAIADILR